MRSSGVWMSVIPLARLTHGKPARVEDVRVGGAAGEPEARLEARAPERVDREPHGEVVVAEAVAAVLRLDPRLERALRDARRERGRVDDLLDDLGDAGHRRASATSASSAHHSATMFRAVPPRMRPTLALVTSSIRPSGMSAIARAAATIAERPSSGYMPACAARPWNVDSSSWAVGEPTTTSPIGAAWS